MVRNTSIVFVLVVLVLLGVFTGPGCASIVPPSGGPRDSLPPALVNVDPPAKTTHFNSKKITLHFNEYVELNDVFQNLVMSPLPKIMPEVTRKLKTVTVKLRDSLEANTTYVLNFRNVIKDLNEGNAAKDLLYVVSTGDYFDTLQLSGRVMMAKTGKPDSTMTAMLYADLKDSAVMKSKPRYIAKPDSAGYFLFRFLAPGTYRLYALKDEGGSYMYSNTEKTFAFYSDSIVVNADEPKARKLWAYSVPPQQEQAEEAAEPASNKNKNTRLKFTSNLQGDKMDLLQPLIFTFEQPLKNFDTTKMALSKDSVFTPVTGYTFKIDSTRKIVTMNIAWEEGTKYNLILQKDFASDSANRALLKTDTVHFTSMLKKEYGQARITFKNLDMNVNPVLLVMQGENIKNAFPLSSNILNIQLYLPGDYELAILQDTNKNRKWDYGDLMLRRQPELITPLSRKMVIKPNWETEFELPVQLSTY